MIAPDVVEKKSAPQFDDLMLAMDAVDTLRHEKSLVDTELTSDERKGALVERLRAYYLDQGIVVTDDILETAVADMDKNRFVHEPLKPGLARTLAHLWVDRRRIGRNLGVSAVALLSCFYVANVSYNKLVIEPRERAAAELALDLHTRLPAALKSAHTQAVHVAEEYQDTVAIDVANNIHDAALKLIDAGKAVEARVEIKRLEDMAGTIAAKIHVAVMQDEAAKIAEGFRSRISDSAALQALNSAFVAVETAASRGLEEEFISAKGKLDELLHRIETKMDLRIVDRDGVRTGVWRSQDGGKTRVHYIVVEAIDSAGQVVSWPIKNVETGRTETVAYWGIRVPEATYNEVGNDKQSDGIVDNVVAGFKPAGKLDFEWSLPSINNQMITRW